MVAQSDPFKWWPLYYFKMKFATNFKLNNYDSLTESAFIKT